MQCTCGLGRRYLGLEYEKEGMPDKNVFRDFAVNGRFIAAFSSST